MINSLILLSLLILIFNFYFIIIIFILSFYFFYFIWMHIFLLFGFIFFPLLRACSVSVTHISLFLFSIWIRFLVSATASVVYLPFRLLFVMALSIFFEDCLRILSNRIRSGSVLLLYGTYYLRLFSMYIT